jgi:hypothetical protein
MDGSDWTKAAVTVGDGRPRQDGRFCALLIKGSAVGRFVRLRVNASYQEYPSWSFVAWELFGNIKLKPENPEAATVANPRPFSPKGFTINPNFRLRPSTNLAAPFHRADLDSMRAREFQRPERKDLGREGQPLLDALKGATPSVNQPADEKVTVGSDEASLCDKDCSDAGV